MSCARRTFSSRRLFLFLLIVALCAPVVALAADVHPLFNLQSTTQSPFPSDRFTAGDAQQNTGLRVNLPEPNCATHLSDCADVALLNQLDGFNPQPRLSIPFDGPIDVSTANSSTIFLVKIPGSGMDGVAFDHFTPQVTGINQIVWDPASLTLFAESDDHLDQRSNYLLVVTTGVHGADGLPIAPSADFTNFRHDDNFGQTKDLQLKAYRHLLIRSMAGDVLGSIGLSPGDVAAASIFTTESVSAALESIRDQIKAAAAPAVSFNLGAGGEKTVFPLNTVSKISFQPQVLVVGPKPSTDLPIAALQVIPGSISTVAFGKFHASNWETADAIIPAVPTRTGTPAVQSTGDLYFNLFIPAGPRPSTGWPVAIFGHGFGDSKQGAPFAVASVLASNGIATISINVVGHGFGPQGTLTVTAGTNTVVLPAGGRGVDQNGDGQIASTEGSTTSPVGSFAGIGSRDALQETAADLMQLVRAIQGGIDTSGSGLPDLDAGRLYYFGQSFGGIYGTIFLGIEPDIRAGVPNVPGGPIIDIVRMSPVFRPLLIQILALRSPALLNAPPPNFFNDNKPPRDEAPLVNTVPGAIAIQTVEDTAIWLGQAGDAVAWAPFIRKSPLEGNAAKRVIVQFARGDQTVPNPTATALIRSGDLADRATFFRNDIAAPLGLGLTNPHAFLTSLPKAVAVEGQLQIAVFLASDGALTLDPDSFGPLLGVPPSVPSLFETPVVTLPEDLGYSHTFPLR